MDDKKTENEPIHMEDTREQQDASTVEPNNDGLEHETIDPDDED